MEVGGYEGLADCSAKETGIIKRLLKICLHVIWQKQKINEQNYASSYNSVMPIVKLWFI